MTAHPPVERPQHGPHLRPQDTGSLQLFLSYCRHDEPLAAAIARDLTDVGIDVWMDRRLSGGQAWWDTILESIRAADGVVFVLSGRSLDSLPCARELGYAQALGRAVLPVRIDDTVPGLAPPSLASLEWVDYDPQDRASVIRLMRAVTSIPAASELPNPLPPAPEVPLSYTTDLAAQVHQPEALPANDQHSLVFQLREGLEDEAHRDECLQLMRQLRTRRELLASVERQIDEALRRHHPSGEAVVSDADGPARAVTEVPAQGRPAETLAPTAPARPSRMWVWLGVAVAVAVLAVAGLFVALGSRTPAVPPAPAPTAPTAPATYGDDALLDQLWDGCAAGDMTACDTLYLEAEIDTAYETFGSTCGLTAEPAYGECAAASEPTSEQPMVYGDDPALDALWDACVAGDLNACDTLYFDAPAQSEYELKGSYCGGASTEPKTGSCAGT